MQRTALHAFRSHRRIRHSYFACGAVAHVATASYANRRPTLAELPPGQDIVTEVNNQLRKYLGRNTAYEAFAHELASPTTDQRCTTYYNLGPGRGKRATIDCTP